MKFIKGLFITLAVLVLLSAGAVYVLVTFYKKELTDMLTETLKTEHGIDLKVKDVNVSFLANWPQASVNLIGVELKGTAFKDSYIRARSLGLTLNLERLLSQEFIIRNVSLRNGEIFLARDTTQRKPVVKTPRKSTASRTPLRFEISKVVFRNVAFTYFNPARGQKIRFDLVDNSFRVKQFADGIAGDLKGRVFVHGLLFKKDRGEFLERCKAKLDLRINYFKDSKSLVVMPGSTAELNGDKHDICVLAELGQKKRLALMVQSSGVDVKRVSALFNNRIRKVMGKFEIAAPLEVGTLLVVNIGKKEDPVVIVRCSGTNAAISIGESAVGYEDVSFKGRIVCLDSAGERGSMENARVLLEDVKGKVQGMPFEAAVRIMDFSRPRVSIRGRLIIDAASAALGPGKDFILGGHAVAHLRYSGLAEKMNPREFLDKDMRLSADIRMKNLSYQERSRPYVYIINGKASVNNRDLRFRDLAVNTEVGDAKVSGRIQGFVHYVLGHNAGFKATIEARTDSLNLNRVLKKMVREAGPAQTLTTVSENKQSPAVRSDSVKKPMVIDRNAFSAFEFDVKLFAEKMFIRQVVAEDAKMDLHYRDEHLKIRSMRANTCGGKISAKGSISNFNSINADLLAEDVDVNRLFEQFENFGQSAVQSHHLKGKLSVQAKFKSLLDDRMEVAGETMYGEVQLRLRDGHLLNFAPVQSLSNVLLKNRDFNDVSFSELNESFVLRGYEMQIEELEIGSNILNLYVVNGVYNFKGESSINVLVPWNNLKKRDKNHIPKRSGLNASDAKGVKVNFSGPPNKMKISLGHKELPGLRPSI